jgi:hypothetical protein
MATSTSTKAKGTARTKAGGKPALKSRAVLRDVEPGSTVECALCGERVKFQAKVRHRQVICNVYVRGTWDRVEHFHSECYEQAGEPHGPVDTTPVVKARARAAAEAKPAEAKSA